MKYSLYIDLVQHGVPSIQAEQINAKYKDIIIKPNKLDYRYESIDGNKTIEINYESDSFIFSAVVPIMINNIKASHNDMKIDFIKKDLDNVEKVINNSKKDYSLYLDLLNHCIPSDQAICLDNLLKHYINEPNMLNYRFNKEGINREIVIYYNDEKYSFEILVPLIKNNDIASVDDIEVEFENKKEDSQAYLEMKNGDFRMSFVRDSNDEVLDGYYTIESNRKGINSIFVKEEFYDDEAYQYYYERQDSYEEYEAYEDIMNGITIEDSPKQIGILPDYKDTYCIGNLSDQDLYNYVGLLIKYPNKIARKINNADKEIDYHLSLNKKRP